MHNMQTRTHHTPPPLDAPPHQDYPYLVVDLDGCWFIRVDPTREEGPFATAYQAGTFAAVYGIPLIPRPAPPAPGPVLAWVRRLCRRANAWFVG